MKETINQEISQTAIAWIGKEEKKGNMGFKDSEFQRKMSTVGHEHGQAWCAYFVELVWKYAYQHWDATLFTRLDKLFNAGAVKTFRNFQKTKDFADSFNPTVGALIVWQKYQDGVAHWSGHIGIVTRVDRKNGEVITIEGNTNDNGGREGYKVASKVRSIDYSIKDGLVLLGFIHPKKV